MCHLTADSTKRKVEKKRECHKANRGGIVTAGSQSPEGGHSEGANVPCLLPLISKTWASAPPLLLDSGTFL